MKTTIAIVLLLAFISLGCFAWNRLIKEMQRIQDEIEDKDEPNHIETPKTDPVELLIRIKRQCESVYYNEEIIIVIGSAIKDKLINNFNEKINQTLEQTEGETEGENELFFMGIPLKHSVTIRSSEAYGMTKKHYNENKELF